MTVWSIDPWFAIPIAVLSVLFVTWIVSLLIRKVRKHLEDQDTYKENFWDIIRDGDYYPSLARFQFLLWTFVISFVFLSIYLIRIFGGEVGVAHQLPDTILQLLGISVATPILGNALSSFKYDSTVSRKRRDDVPPFTTMLLENDKPVLFRYQMFLWTFVGIGIYLFIFFSTISITISDIQKAAEIKCDQLPANEAAQKGCTSLKQLNQLNMPPIDPSLVILMGLSQGGYLGGKLVARTPIRISRLITGTSDGTLCILGENLGSGGLVLVDSDKIASGPANGVSWTDTRIDLPLLNLGKLKENSVLEVLSDDGTRASTTINSMEKEGRLLLAATDKAATDKAATDKAATDKAATDKAATDKAA
ncbi:MAG TPA: hypothetical protein VH500_14045, partial [Nitrososphaeraceae archaeon]